MASLALIYTALDKFRQDLGTITEIRLNPKTWQELDLAEAEPYLFIDGIPVVLDQEAPKGQVYFLNQPLDFLTNPAYDELEED